jgi:hypothetical protein
LTSLATRANESGAVITDLGSRIDAYIAARVCALGVRVHAARGTIRRKLSGRANEYFGSKARFRDIKYPRLADRYAELAARAKVLRTLGINSSPIRPNPPTNRGRVMGR